MKIVNDILLDMNRQHVFLLVLLDLRVAFDTVDHTIRLRRLETLFGVIGNVPKWFASYLSGRSQRVTVNGELSNRFHLSFNLVFRKGLVFGHFSSLFMPAKLFKVIENHLPNAHAYADDIQHYLAFKPESSVG